MIIYTADIFQCPPSTRSLAELLSVIKLPLTQHNIHSNRAEARSSKVKKILLPLLLALKLKLALVLPIVLKAITLISLKGLAAGTIALLFSGATFVKDLLAKKQEHITTAYISGAGAQPVNAEFVHHHGNDWNRNGQAAAAQDLAYNYHTLPQYV